ncbi:MAG: glycosyl hydrolase [Salinivirgaceae bacterium]|jgi:hypothetical protein|nr:glycosyl hydrolase [Salinivirgaceae bacterium]
MNKRILSIIIYYIIAGSISSNLFAQVPELSKSNDFPFQDKPLVNPNPSVEAKAVFRYIQDMYGKKMLSGQMWAPWGVQEIDYVESNTGKKPAIVGLDFIHENDNDREVQRAINYWNAGGIPTIMWHWGAPGVGEGYENSKVGIDINKCFEEGTLEYESMWSELKAKADHLETLRDANVPVLWRPFHELNGGWFWWGMQGSDLFEKLWITMYNYFVNDRELNNLIWVLCYTGYPDGDWYPGDEYVDIAGPDNYGVGDDPQLRMYNEVKEIVANNKMPIAYHECGMPPNPDECLNTGAMWSWWMQWHTGHLTDTDVDYLNEVYNHSLVITLDEVPDIVTAYGWDENCNSSTINAKIKVDEGEWMDTTIVTASEVSEFHLSVDSEDEGTWEWSGCGASGNGKQQTILATEACNLTATFTNACGAVTTQAFNILRPCVTTEIIPYVKLNGGEWQQTNSITVGLNSVVKLGPEASEEGGYWEWTGSGISSVSRQLTISPTETSTYTVNYTNYCNFKSEQDFTIYVETTSATMRNENENRWKVFPNPIENMINITSTKDLVNENDEIEIYSTLGKKLAAYNLDNREIIIDASNYNAGTYIVKIKSQKSIETFIINKVE